MNHYAQHLLQAVLLGAERGGVCRLEVPDDYEAGERRDPVIRIGDKRFRVTMEPVEDPAPVGPR